MDAPFYFTNNQSCSSDCGTIDNIISLNTEFQCFQSVTCNKSVTIRVSSGQILSFCVNCTGATPFFDKTIMQCVSQCNQESQYVDANNICLQQCDTVNQQLSHIIENYSRQYQQCDNCQNKNQFKDGINCVSQCQYQGSNTYFTAYYDTYNCSTGSCNGILSNPITQSGYDVQYCFSCPLNQPFYNPANNSCTASCPEAVDEQGICTPCPANMVLNPVIDRKTQLPIYRCQQSCSTNQQINRVCQSCFNISRARSLFDPDINQCVSSCSKKYNYNNQQINLVDQDMVCTDQNQNYINQIQTYGSEVIYQTNMLAYSFQEEFLAGGWPTVKNCSKFVYNGRCINECPVKINQTNVVDINMHCLNQTSVGYLENVSGQNYQIFHPLCDEYLVPKHHNHSVKCVSQCTNFTLDAIGQKLCLDNYTCDQKIIVTQQSGYLPQFECQPDCPSGYSEIISKVCVQESTCRNYFLNRCNNSLDGPGCKNQYLNDQLQCVETCLPKFAINFTCVDSCSNHAPPLVVSSNGMDCAEQCQRSDRTEVKGQETYCVSCAPQVNDENVCKVSCPDVRPYNDSGRCDTQCTNQSQPFLLLYNTSICVATCPDYLVAGTFGGASAQFCVSSCALSEQKFVKSETERVCIGACGAAEVVLTGNVCFACRGETPYKLNNSCVRSCAANALLVEEAVCVASCSPGRRQTTAATEKICVTMTRNLAAPIAGGVVGGICFLVLIALIALGALGKLSCCKKKNKLKDTEEHSENGPEAQKDTVTNYTTGVVTSALIKSGPLSASQAAMKSRGLTPLPETGRSTTQEATEAPEPIADKIQVPRRRRRVRRPRQLENDAVATDEPLIPLPE